jgi:hypothetical protein
MHENEVNRDVLLSAGVGGDADDVQWSRIVERAHADHGFALDFVRQSRDRVALERLLARATERRAVPTNAPIIVRHAPPVAARFGGWTGWLVAAALLGLWFHGGIRAPQPPERSGSPILDVVHREATAQGGNALDDRFSEELPHRMLIEARPMPDGSGTELIYLRQLIERRVVPELYRLDGQNELGQPSLVRYVPSSGGSV